MQTFFLFISDLFHQVLFYFGTVFAMAVLVIEKFFKPIARPWVFAAAMLCLFVACFQAWLDEHRNTVTVIEEKAIQAGLNNTCQTDARVAQAYLQGVQSLNAAQRQTIDNQQIVNGKQQLAVNSCVISLGKMNPLVNAEIRVLIIPTGRLTTPSVFKYGAPTLTYISAVVISSNRRANPHGNLKCANAFIPGAPALPVLHTGTSSPVNPIRISDTEYELNVIDTVSEWNAGTPFYLVATSDQETFGPCSFALAQ